MDDKTDWLAAFLKAHEAEMKRLTAIVEGRFLMDELGLEKGAQAQREAKRIRLAAGKQQVGQA